jgi:hypothetical protein
MDRPSLLPSTYAWCPTIANILTLIPGDLLLMKNDVRGIANPLLDSSATHGRGRGAGLAEWTDR